MSDEVLTYKELISYLIRVQDQSNFDLSYNPKKKRITIEFES